MSAVSEPDAYDFVGVIEKRLSAVPSVNDCRTFYAPTLSAGRVRAALTFIYVLNPRGASAA
jgi:hypothetical protein